MAMRLINSTVKVLPSGYSLNAVIATPQTISGALPLVIFCHGSGEAGTNITTMYNQGLPNVLQAGYQPPFDFIMVAPQANSYGVNPDWLPYILADIQSRYTIDVTRIYITGLSAGGWATFGSQMNETTTFGSIFAAIAPLSAATQDLTAANYVNFKTTKTPVWAVVGANDTSYVANNQALINNINAQVGGLAVMYTRPGIGHDKWIDIYNGTYRDTSNRTIWDWLQTKTRGASVSAPVINSTFSVAATKGSAFTYSLTATNNPTSFTANALPAGLTINTSTGVISGTPSTSGITPVSVSAINAGGTGTATLTITVNNPAPTVVNVITLYSDGTYTKV